MAAKKRGLGRGLDSLFTDNSPEGTKGSSVSLPIGDIEPNRAQPRRFFDEEALTQLSESIAENGILQPLLVRPMTDGSYQLVAGERRWRAARRAGLTEVPVLIRALTDEEVAAMTLVENLQREDLNPVEEAKGIDKLMNDYGYTQEQTAEKLGKSRPAITNSLRLLALPSEVLEYVRDGLISAGHARALLSLQGEETIRKIAEHIIAKGLSVRETEKLVKKLTKPDVERQPKQRDIFFDEVELALSDCLGRKARIIEGKKGGKLEIEFFDKEDLKKIAKLFED